MLCSLTLTTTSQPVYAMQGQPIPPIRVSLTIGRPSSLTFMCHGRYDLIDSRDGSVLASPQDAQVRFSIKDGGVSIEIGDAPIDSPSGPVFRLVPKSSECIAEFIYPNTRYRRYRDALEITATAPPLKVINELPLEDYVRGVIPAEVSGRSPLEAQKAMTVAIRTYALKSMETSRHKANGCHLCDTIDCQGFAGASKDGPWVERLIEATQGQVATYDGKIICALYSTDCGGMTQGNDDAGIGKSPWPYLRPVADRPGGGKPESTIHRVSDDGSGVDTSGQPVDYCAASQFHDWSQTYTLATLEKTFSRYRSTRVGKLQSIEFPSYDSSGRVKSMMIRGDAGECVITGNQLREVLRDMLRLKSTRITLTLTPEGDYRIDGKGYGHGIGLCAAGADGYAKSDPRVTYIDILKHYYTGIEVTKLDGTKLTTPESGSDDADCACPPGDNTSGSPDTVTPEPPTRPTPPREPAKREHPKHRSPTPSSSGGLVLRGRTADQGG